MKKIIIVFLAAVLLGSISILYRNSQASMYYNKELADSNYSNQMDDKILLLYLFFSKKSCPSCMDMISELNEFKNPIVVRGVIPENEMPDKDSICTKLGIKFEIVSSKNYKHSFPIIYPALVGTSQDGEVLIVMPTVTGSVKYIREYIMRFYSSSFYYRS